MIHQYQQLKQKCASSLKALRLNKVRIIKLREKCVQYMKVTLVTSLIQIGKHITAGNLVNMYMHLTC